MCIWHGCAEQRTGRVLTGMELIRLREAPFASLATAVGLAILLLIETRLRWNSRWQALGAALVGAGVAGLMGYLCAMEFSMTCFMTAGSALEGVGGVDRCIDLFAALLAAGLLAALFRCFDRADLHSDAR